MTAQLQPSLRRFLCGKPMWELATVLDKTQQKGIDPECPKQLVDNISRLSDQPIDKT